MSVPVAVLFMWHVLTDRLSDFRAHHPEHHRLVPELGNGGHLGSRSTRMSMPQRFVNLSTRASTQRPSQHPAIRSPAEATSLPFCSNQMLNRSTVSRTTWATVPGHRTPTPTKKVNQASKLTYQADRGQRPSSVANTDGDMR